MDASYNTPIVRTSVFRCYLPDYSVKKDLPDRVFTNTFRVEEHVWEQQVQIHAESISFHVGLKSGPSVEATATLDVEDKLGKVALERKIVKYFTPGGLHGESFAFARFIDKREVHRFLVNDALTFCVTLEVVVGESVKRGEVPQNSPDLDLGQQLIGWNGDLEFQVQGEKIKAHRLVLMARSPFFRAQLESPADDRDKFLQVDDIQPPVFKAMLEFLYTDSVPASIPLVQDLLVAAAKYELDELHKCCAEFLCINITKMTVSRSLGLAERYQLTELKEACLNFVRGRALGTFFKSREFSSFFCDRESLC